MDISIKRLPRPTFALAVIAVLIVSGCSQSSSTEATPLEPQPPPAPESGPFTTLNEASEVGLDLGISLSVGGFDKSKSPEKNQSNLVLNVSNSDRNTPSFATRPVTTPVTNPITRPPPTRKPLPKPLIPGVGTPRPRPDSVASLLCEDPSIAFDTITVITGPDENGELSAGTTLSWQRTEHDICGNIGHDRNYSIAVCAERISGNCNPSNGFYRGNVSPEDLGWDPTTPGHYMLNADQIDEIKEKAEVDVGDTVHLQIRYSYKQIREVRGLWDTRQLILSENPEAPLSSEPIKEAPFISFPSRYSANGDFTASWNPVLNADYYRVKLAYRGLGNGSTDVGSDNGESETRETAATSFTFTELAPAYTALVVWNIAGCNSSGCGPVGVYGNFVEYVLPDPATSFSTIIKAFRAPSCVNCHAVTANDADESFTMDFSEYENLVPSEFGYEVTGPNFGKPLEHPAGDNCVVCHTANLTPEGSHPVPWMAPPASMDLRGKSDLQLCQMARNPGTLAEDIQDHLLGDPLILWAVEGGPLPQMAGNTDNAFGTNREAARNEWERAVINWVEGGASCD